MNDPAQPEAPTPRTDALALELGHLPDLALRDDLGTSEFWTAINHARELEIGLTACRKALEAQLLFYSIGPWDGQKKTEWCNLTGTNEATTKNLCDCARAALATGKETP